MRAGAAADDPFANGGDLLSGLYGIPRGHQDIIDMAILNDSSRAKVDFYVVSISTWIVIISGDGNNSSGNGNHGRASAFPGNINPIVQDAVPIPEGGGNGRAPRCRSDIAIDTLVGIIAASGSVVAPDSLRIFWVPIRLGIFHAI